MMKVVEKVLVSVPERSESKISYIEEDSENLSRITLPELATAL